MISSNELRPGTTIEYREGVWQIVESMHVKPGKGAAFVQTKLKNMETDEVLRVNFRAAERLQQANVDKLTLTYIYRDGRHYVLMDTSSHESIKLGAVAFGNNADLLIEGLEGITALRHRDRIIRLDLPTTVDITVTETPPNERGDTSSGGNKQATLESGAVVTVPFHIRAGDKIRVDTRTREYIGRVGLMMKSRGLPESGSV